MKNQMLQSEQKILVVEDDPDILRLLAHTLSNAGYQVVQAYGGEDALRKVKSHRPCLVLTDLAMPKMSGVEIIARVKGDPETSHIPVLAVTAYMWDTIAKSAGQAGVDGYISKPFNSQLLLREIAKILGAPPRAPSSKA
jgi:CheY-like chemotaxis protein